MKIRVLTVTIGFVCAALLLTRPALAQFSQQGQKLVGSGAEDPFGAGVFQGWSVGLSGDGNTAIIGGYDDNLSNGAAWIFTKNGGAWTQQGPKLFDRVNDGDFQGFSVALSGDGNTAIIGADIDHSGVGAAYIWTRSGGVWTQQGQSKLVGSNVLGGQAFQGSSVALSGDGHTAIIGGIFDDNQVGAAWIFTGSGGSWHEQQKLVGTGAIGKSQQGWSVALSGDGNTAIVGGLTDNTDIGAAWVWNRTGATWTQAGEKLVAYSQVGDFHGSQGSSVALSANGDTALVGAYTGYGTSGSAFVWSRTGFLEPWTSDGTNLISGYQGTAGALEGTSVSLSADGNTALVGGPAGNSGVGSAWIWRRTGMIWYDADRRQLLGSGAAGAASQGYSVSLSGDGKTALVGGFSDNNNAGAAWVFADTPSVGNSGRGSVSPVLTPTPAPVERRDP